MLKLFFSQQKKSLFVSRQKITKRFFWVASIRKKKNHVMLIRDSIFQELILFSALIVKKELFSPNDVFLQPAE